MSTDLAFWYDPEPSRRDPQAVYEKLLEGQRVEGLGDIAWEATLAELAARFPGIESVSPTGYSVWESPEGEAAIEIFTSPQHLLAIARGEVNNDDLNVVISACLEVGGARLYDPQIGVRFDSF